MVVCQKNVNFNKLNLVMQVLSVDNEEVWLVQLVHIMFCRFTKTSMMFSSWIWNIKNKIELSDSTAFWWSVLAKRNFMGTGQIHNYWQVNQNTFLLKNVNANLNLSFICSVITKFSEHFVLCIFVAQLEYNT